MRPKTRPRRSEDVLADFSGTMIAAMFCFTVR